MPGLLESYYYWTRARAAETPPSDDYIASVLALSPSAGWAMQEASGNLTDGSGNGWTATQVGTPTYSVAGPAIASETFSAITFGTGNYFTIASTLTDPATTGFTLSAWVKHPFGAGGRPIFWNNSTGQGTFYLRKGNSYGIQVVTINTVDGAHGSALDGTDNFDDTWTWVGARYDSGAGVLRAYYDTSTFDDTAFDGTWKRDGDPTTVRIGASTADAFDGEMCLLYYWNAPLTDAQMTSLRTGAF